MYMIKEDLSKRNFMFLPLCKIKDLNVYKRQKNLQILGFTEQLSQITQVK